MLKKGKKILCTLLVMVMCLTAAPLSGLVDFGITASALEASDSCGENVTYTYDSTTGEVVISGTGAMTDYSDYGGSPFYSNAIKSVVIEDGVTSIGGSAFNGCTSLASVTIPDSVTSIGDWAFYYCTSLASVTIPDSVTSIGYEAFSGCTSLASVTVNADNQYYSSDEYGALFNKDKTTLIQYPAGNTRTAYSIPDSVTSIGDWAFAYCESLASVTIPDSVISIGDYAFAYCESLASVTIPDSVTSIGKGAFHNCTSLESVTIGDSVTTIGFDAFYNCESLASVTIGDSVTSIGYYAFAYCESFASVTIPDSVTSIGEGAFHNCTSLASVTIGDSVTSIDYYAFCNCTSLASVTIPDSVTTIGYSAFRDCTSLESVTIPDSVTSIDYSAFYNCTSLTDVYYGGTEEQWNSITIGEYNECLTGATIHFGTDIHTHSYTSAVTKAATCTEAGVITYTCSCGNSYTEAIPATGHKDANGDYKCDNGCGYEYERPEDPSENCSCRCHKGGFIWKILVFFYKLLRINPVCDCGIAHY